MTTNAIRISIINRILQMDRGALLSLQEAMAHLRRSSLPADLPEWIPVSQAADFLHITPRHIRRICADQLHITYQRREYNGNLCWHLHRDLLRCLIESATERQPRAKRQPKTADTAKNVRTSDHTLKTPLEPTSSPVATALESRSRDEANFQTTPDIPARSPEIFKVPAPTARRA